MCGCWCERYRLQAPLCRTNCDSIDDLHLFVVIYRCFIERCVQFHWKFLILFFFPLAFLWTPHRSRSTRSSVDSGAPRSYFGDDGFGIDGIDASSLYGSQYSFCSCSHCEDQQHDKKNPLYGRTDLRLSICER